MVRLLKMVADVSLLLRIFRLDSIKMSLNSIHASQLCLSYILLFACLACYAIDDIRTFTGYIFPGNITAASESTCYPAAVIQNCAIFAILGLAFVARITIEFTRLFGWFFNCWYFGPD